MDDKVVKLKKTEKNLKRIFFFFLLIIILMIDFSCLVKKKRLNIAEMKPNERLRGIYLGGKNDIKQDRLVGCIAIRLLEDGAEKIVKLDHPFRSKDMFRFEISSNKDGWIYLFHKSPYNDPQLLWPRMDPKNKDKYLDLNMIRANQTCIVPRDPSWLIFDEKIGSEIIYLIIRSQRKMPEIMAFDNSLKDQSSSVDSINEIKQFIVRGGKETDPNSYTYFASPDNNGFVMIEFQLMHQ